MARIILDEKERQLLLEVRKAGALELDRLDYDDPKWDVLLELLDVGVLCRAVEKRSVVAGRGKPRLPGYACTQRGADLADEISAADTNPGVVG